VQVDRCCPVDLLKLLYAWPSRPHRREGAALERRSIGSASGASVVVAVVVAAAVSDGPCLFGSSTVRR